MPYYIHPREREADPQEDPVYLSASLAGRQLPNYPDCKVTFIASQEETRHWKQREQMRASDGTYLPVPWPAYQPAYPGCGHPDCCPPRAGYDYRDHFAHLSLTKPGMIAFTQSEQHGIEDRQTLMRPGRYLKQYYADHFSEEECEGYVSLCAAERFVLSFATTAEDIVRVYVGGPDSCMAGKHQRFNANGHHPVEVYGSSDLAVAYYGDIDHASGRAVVWPDRKLFSRIYDGNSTLRTLLQSAGFTSGSMNGARVRAIPVGDTYLMPYVDGISSGKLSRDRQWILLGEEGSLECQRTDGRAAEQEDENDDVACERCDNYYPSDSLHNGYCDACWDAVFTCYRCHDTFERSVYSPQYPLRIDGSRLTTRSLCPSCFEHEAVSCDLCDTTFFPGQTLDLNEREDRQRRGVSRLCVPCSRVSIHCATCDRYHAHTPEPGADSSYALRFRDDSTIPLCADVDPHLDGLRTVPPPPPDPIYTAHCPDCLVALPVPDGQTSLPLSELDVIL